MGAEFGHTKLVYNGRRCTCGQLGCVDAYCSATGLVASAREAITEQSLLWELCCHDPEKIDAKMIESAVGEGDPCAVEVWETYIDRLAAATGNLIVVFRPEIVVLGGGVAKAGEMLLKPLQERVLKTTFAGSEIGVPKIKAAECGNDAGIIGAAMLERFGFRRGGTIDNQGGKENA